MGESVKLSLVQLDLDISDNVIEIIKDKYNFESLYFLRLLKSEIQEGKSQFSLNCKKHFNNGELVPEYLIENYLEELLLKSKKKRILLIDFPNNFTNQNILKKIILKHNIEMQICWYIRHKNSDEFKKNHFEEENNKAWLSKFGDEVIEVWNERNSNKKKSVRSIISLYSNFDWKIIDVTVFEMNDSEFLFKKL